MPDDFNLREIADGSFADKPSRIEFTKANDEGVHILATLVPAGWMFLHADEWKYSVDEPVSFEQRRPVYFLDVPNEEAAP